MNSTGRTWAPRTFAAAPTGPTAAAPYEIGHVDLPQRENYWRNFSVHCDGETIIEFCIPPADLDPDWQPIALLVTIEELIARARSAAAGAAGSWYGDDVLQTQPGSIDRRPRPPVN